ncbi:MAG: hypothetical protein KAU02_01940 [Tenericutes bacterium]|nr:hypothetical protein [Mycoplasmatota bacterium]
MKINYQRSVIVIFLFALFSVMGVMVVGANSGPPSNVQIQVINNEVDFNFDLLIDNNSLLSQNQIDQALIRIASGDYDYEYNDTAFLIYMASYQDSEGFVSNLLYGNPEFYRTYDYDDDRGYIATMYLNVPKEFKALLYTDTEVIITSELIIMSQFDFRLTFDLVDVDMSINQNNVGVVSGYIGNPWGNLTTWVNFLLRLILTLGIELGVLYLFGFKKKSTYIFVTLMNVVSQILLNIALIAAFYNNPSGGYNYIFTFIIGEFVVFTLELVIISIFVKEHRLFKKIEYSLCANTASLVIGLLLASSLSFLI